MTDLPETDRQRLMNVVFATEAAVREVLNPDKVNLASLGNMVPHLHWHVIPRFADDRHFPDAIWADARRPANCRPAAEPNLRPRLARTIAAFLTPPE
jgi:diadenosine tetraphosphate (Ap4A) HIT family hydrolase